MATWGVAFSHFTGDQDLHGLGGGGLPAAGLLPQTCHTAGPSRRSGDCDCSQDDSPQETAFLMGSYVGFIAGGAVAYFRGGDSY